MVDRDARLGSQKFYINIILMMYILTEGCKYSLSKRAEFKKIPQIIKTQALRQVHISFI